ncbi:MAG: LacI family transcriptional regulator [Saprospiraceae bacterium]|jgi:LacI family transcriptional regulator
MAQIRIKDIAAKAGVSVGTVDRVLHGRGRVSKIKESKIKEAIKALNYQPNLAARTLATRVNYRLATIIPISDDDDFWASQKKGIERAKRYMKDFGFEIDSYEFNDQENGSLLKMTNKILLGNYDAIVIAPNMEEDSSAFLDICDQHHLPYVQINSFLDRGSQYSLGFIGQDSFQSGLLGAKLLDISTHTPGTFLILHMEREASIGEHMIKKEKGFKSYFKEYSKHNIVVEHIPPDKNKAEIKNRVQTLMKQYPNISGVFVTTSRSHLIARALLDLDTQEITIVGFDLIKENIEVLSDYKRLFLINQNPALQGYYGLMNFFDRFLKKKINPTHKYLPLDVITLENVVNYIHIEQRDRSPEN